MPNSEPTLDALVAAMEKEPEAQIEIAGHTDLSKDPARSMRLSQSRANTIRNYLMESGVEPGRIRTTGFGSTKPIYRVSDARNRRVEVRVL
jgi:OmpA-OmpF porin, OOP family